MHHVVCCSDVEAHACRSLAVATGKFSVAELEAAGATRAVATLEDVADIIQWLRGE